MGESLEEHVAEYLSQGTEDGVEEGDRIAPFVATKESEKFVVTNIIRAEGLLQKVPAEGSCEPQKRVII